jgi:beta-glucosidase
MYAFGHGLSYVDFEYSDLQANKAKYRANDVIKLTFNLTNNGTMAADEVAQVYVKRLDAKVEWPVKELKAFQRVNVAAGQTQQVTIEIPVESLRYWDVDADTWMLENGNIEIMVGGSSDDLRLTTQVAI